MPKSNVDFWKKKFSQNIERDRRIVRELENLGWRVLVVWECELIEKTVETVYRVAYWLRQANVTNCSEILKKDLLSVAEKKVRFRISSYDEKSD